MTKQASRRVAGQKRCWCLAEARAGDDWWRSGRHAEHAAELYGAGLAPSIVQASPLLPPVWAALGFTEHRTISLDFKPKTMASYEAAGTAWSQGWVPAWAGTARVAGWLEARWRDGRLNAARVRKLAARFAYPGAAEELESLDILTKRSGALYAHLDEALDEVVQRPVVCACCGGRVRSMRRARGVSMHHLPRLTDEGETACSSMCAFYLTSAAGRASLYGRGRLRVVADGVEQSP